jgi:hypothetical protein
MIISSFPNTAACMILSARAISEDPEPSQDCAYAWTRVIPTVNAYASLALGSFCDPTTRRRRADKAGQKRSAARDGHEGHTVTMVELGLRGVAQHSEAVLRVDIGDLAAEALRRPEVHQAMGMWRVAACTRQP